jgi:hypothetical protein
MKTWAIILLTVFSLNAFSQGQRKVSRATPNTTPRTAPPVGSVNPQTTDHTQPLAPRQTATDRYLNGPARNGNNTTQRPATRANNNSPFVGGVHPGENAAKRFDTVANRNNLNTGSANNTTIRGGNDTTFNVNTTMTQGGVTTNSGAVDRSGQAQFGQTNWGNSRSTVGESQWTIPPPITASFNKDFPESNRATWTRNNVDTTIYSARYRSGAQWVTTNYNASGQRLDMRTEFPLVQPPRAVSVYIAKQPAGFRAATIYKLQVQGKPDVYEIETASGKKIYLNNEGMEINY